MPREVRTPLRPAWVHSLVGPFFPRLAARRNALSMRKSHCLRSRSFISTPCESPRLRASSAARSKSARRARRATSAGRLSSATISETRCAGSASYVRQLGGLSTTIRARWLMRRLSSVARRCRPKIRRASAKGGPGGRAALSMCPEFDLSYFGKLRINAMWITSD